MSNALLERAGGIRTRAWDDEDDASEFGADNIVVGIWDEDDGHDPGSHGQATRSALELLSPVAHEEPTEAREDRQEGDDQVRQFFEELADELAHATRGLSSTRLARRHPAYAEIMALGERSIPWLVERLDTPGERPIWLRLLGSLTRFQPGAGKDTIPEAAEAWIQWNKQRAMS